MSSVSIWVIAIAMIIPTSKAFASESDEKVTEQISVRKSLAVHLGLVKDQEIVFGTPRDFRSSAFDSASDIQPMNEKEAEEADQKADSSEEISNSSEENSISSNSP